MNAACKVWVIRMSSSRILLHPSYVLHSRAYQDTSLIIDVFSRDHGRVSALAKGAKQAKSKFNGLLQPFKLLLLSWSGRGEMFTLTGAEYKHRPLILKGESLLAAFYINELILKLTQRHDPHPELFDAYHLTIQQLEAGNDNEPVLRKFECYLLQEIGYGLILDHDVESGEPVQPDKQYCYYPEQGPVMITQTESNSQALTVRGAMLQALQHEQLSDEIILREAKHFMRAIIHHRLDGRPIRTRELNFHKVL